MNSSASLVARICTAPKAADLLASVFDFYLAGPGDEPVEPIHLASKARLDAVARDASGGMYFLCGDGGEDRPVLYADTEGGAITMARSLSEAVATVIRLPYWVDCLAFSNGGELESMRASVDALEEERLEDEPDLERLRDSLLQTFGLHLDDAVGTLHAAATELGSEYVVLNEAGEPYSSLLGPFDT